MPMKCRHTITMPFIHESDRIDMECDGLLPLLTRRLAAALDMRKADKLFFVFIRVHSWFKRNQGFAIDSYVK